VRFSEKPQHSRQECHQSLWEPRERILSCRKGDDRGGVFSAKEKEKGLSGRSFNKPKGSRNKNKRRKQKITAGWEKRSRNWSV